MFVASPIFETRCLVPESRVVVPYVWSGGEYPTLFTTRSIPSFLRNPPRHLPSLQRVKSKRRKLDHPNSSFKATMTEGTHQQSPRPGPMEYHPQIARATARSTYKHVLRHHLKQHEHSDPHLTLMHTVHAWQRKGQSNSPKAKANKGPVPRGSQCPVLPP